MPLPTRHLGLLAYRDAWAIQQAEHARVVAGESPGVLLSVEHPPVITLGRRSEVSASHLLAPAETLARLGVEVVESDRGGDITFHGPGQIVIYPILRLADHRLSVGNYVRLLQLAVLDALADLGLTPQLDSRAPGVWHPTPAGLAKVCAIGVRVRSGVCLHGLALNVTTDLSYFELIDPCGLGRRPVTSLQLLLAERCPELSEARDRVLACLSARLAATAG